MVTVVIADDHPMFREGLQALLDAQPKMTVLAAVENGISAVAAVRRLTPDIAVLDLSMPDGDGYEAAREITKCSPQTRILLLTSHDSDQEISAALAAGGHGYLLKSATPEEIVDAVSAVASGSAVLSDAALASLTDSVDRSAGAEANRVFPELTSRELQVVEYLATGMSNDDIAMTLHLSGKTVRNYVSNILVKLGVTDRTAAAVEARRRGLGH